MPCGGWRIRSSNKIRRRAPEDKEALSAVQPLSCRRNQNDQNAIDLHLPACHNPRIVRRFSASILILAFAALGSGVLLHMHNAAHAAEHAHVADAAGDAHEHAPIDARTCDLHGKLTLPMLPAGFTPVLIALGLFVAFLTQLTPAWNSAFAHVRLDCRGPPVC